MPYLIYAVALLEGFTTLSVEIVALRQFTPIMGSNSISTSIILWIILLALSYWYYRWWVIADRGTNVKKRLFGNLIISSVYYMAITFSLYKYVWFISLSVLGNYSVAIFVTSLLLFVIPVFFASQTIPLLAVLLQGKGNGENIWKLLFYSTIGSFLGSVGTSVVLFPILWVTKTAIVSPIFLSICALCISVFFIKKKPYITISCVFFVLYLAVFSSRVFLSEGTLFQKANAYHNIRIFEDEETSKRYFLMNDAFSSGIDTNSKESFFWYIREVKKQLRLEKPRNVLVIWAAGFTFPQEIAQFDFVERIDVVDVDKSLPDITEKYFLQEKLSEKIHFYAQPSRYFLNTVESTYDFIFIDVYTGRSLPPQVLTQEFFQKVSSLGKSIYFNFILDASFSSHFAHNLFSTLESVFPEVYYKEVNGVVEGITNIIVTNISSSWYTKNTLQEGSIYTDDRHTIEYDSFLLEHRD